LQECSPAQSREHIHTTQCHANAVFYLIVEVEALSHRSLRKATA
jgi:hypothetical protein